ncbi:alpha/beta hydrolase [Dyadobacter arcticus]|uniref:Enterochelin esterase-like enzyme n=1 Tax=Dyadobacter arcticus TaxID=1078754 RepID=A0ABX0URL4_9BACT|nr:alpha/beta hydrolase-fold protein [Dyadobacter arcticus]NIJ54260.1 enterochelin esterase-like enzyme [Dyadobacter arcticus]
MKYTKQFIGSKLIPCTFKFSIIIRKVSLSKPYPAIISDTKRICSTYLNREVIVTINLPAGYDWSRIYPLILFNDGQDFDALNMVDTLNELISTQVIHPYAVVGIHANFDRIYEYGTAFQADYADRGNKAMATTDFVLKELLPFLGENYNVLLTNITYAGFSLGGLMALDMVWNHPAVFSRAGVFSGSLWWRQKALDEGYSDSDRIMHAQIRNTEAKAGLKFWFQCGSLDEYDDRDGDGVIDSVQDTLECISELEKKGYRWNQDVFYTEIEDGRHNSETWSTILPDFFQWVSAHSEPASNSALPKIA